MVLTGTDALRLDTTERPYRSRLRFARQIVTRLALILRMLVTCNDDVGTHGLCVRCVKSYSVVVLTGTDALRLDTTERPYKSLHVSSDHLNCEQWRTIGLCDLFLLPLRSLRQRRVADGLRLELLY